MRLTALMMSCLFVLTACGVGTSVKEFAGLELSSQSVSAEPAWNERVGLGAKISKLTLRDAAGQILSTQTFKPSVSFIDLPAAPARAYSAIPSSMTLATYAQAPSQTELELYEMRGTVELKTNQGTFVLKPFGSVVTAELNLIAGVSKSVKSGCADFFSHLDASAPTFSFSNDTALASQSGNWVCFRTANIGLQDTTSAKMALEASLATYPHANYTQEVSDTRFLVAKNIVSDLDGSSAYGFDPACDELENLIEPAAQQGDFALISDLRTAVTASYLGAGVNIRIVGGDIQDNEAGACDNGFSGHEYNVASIISEIAPSASLSNALVCNDAGACMASDVIRGMLNLYLDAHQSGSLFLANMSMGSPLADPILEASIKLLGTITKPVNVIVSAGNNPNAAAHYPASWAKGVAASGGINNLLSAAAVGQNSNTGTIEIAGFNTRKNSSFMAFGVNVCAGKINNRCDPGASYPENLGLNGTSFAAPVVTAVAALFVDARNDIPQDLHRCLSKSLAVDKDSSVSYVAFSTYFASRFACRP